MTAASLDEVSPNNRLGNAPGVSEREMMPGGLVLSGTLHLAIVALIILGLPGLFRQPPPEETPIAVQLVTIAPDTRATHPNPFQPKPDAKPEPAVAAPAPKPEPKPEPPPPAAEPPSAAAPPPVPAPLEPAKAEVKTPPPVPPPPKPVEAQAPLPAPIRPPEPKPKPEPQQAAPAPHPEPKRADPAAFSKLLKNLEEKKAEPAAFDTLLKNLTKQQTAQSDEPPSSRRLAAAAAPSSQPKAPLGSQLTASELDALASEVLRQLTPCWNIPAGARDARDLVVEIKASVSQDGTVRQATIVDQSRMSDPLYRAAAESARRTFFNPTCTPLKLPADKYEVWKDLVVDFNPKDIL